MDFKMTSNSNEEKDLSVYIRNFFEDSNMKFCDRLADNSMRFYQCLTCDFTGQLYICELCLINGDHINLGHNYTVVNSFSLNEVYFCNCGDFSGRIGCSKHPKLNIVSTKLLPLHFNPKKMKFFVQDFNISEESVRKLSRLNQIRSVGYNGEDGKMIRKYFEQSNAHNMQMFIRGAYRVFRKDHEKRFYQMGYKNAERKLLWHGTKLRNLESILREGFKCPKSFGLMYGNGIYFADRVSKSAQYCDNSGVEILLLCDVSLGEMCCKKYADQTLNTAPGMYESVKGVGRSVPDTSEEGIRKGAKVPLGRTITDILSSGTSLQYNEYVIYDPSRVRIKFIVYFDRNKFNNFGGWTQNASKTYQSYQQFISSGGSPTIDFNTFRKLPQRRSNTIFKFY